MLLLVLILVVIAFGLLVVALLTGSVMWAWVSVGVSVVAAVVLLVDWLLRRSAVRAGAFAAVEAPARSMPMADLDPATEILPVVPASARGGSVAEAPSVERTDRVPDAQQTVVMPVVQPPGSSARPSGAEATITSSGLLSSPSVTKTGSDSPAPTSVGDGADDATRTFSGGGETVSISKEEAAAAAVGREPAAAEPTADEPAEDAARPATASGSELTIVTALPVVTPGEPGPAAEKVDIRKPDDAAAEPQPPGDVERKSPGDVERTVRVQALTPREPAGTSATEAAADPAPATHDPVDTPSADAPPPVTEAAVPEPPEEEAPAAEAAVPGPPPEADVPPGPDADETTAQTSSRRQEPVDLFAAAAAAPVEAPPGPPDEAPEEPRDDAAAELVKRLDDEVVVVDEQPRYHVGGCRALVATAVIPLPVREAVELGFTPCGWCSPDRTLAGRHPTAAR